MKGTEKEWSGRSVGRTSKQSMILLYQRSKSFEEAGRGGLGAGRVSKISATKVWKKYCRQLFR